MTDAPLVRPLPEGPLDLVGDVHGEFDALRSLLGRLGYREAGTHPEGRRPVFLGARAVRREVEDKRRNQPPTDDIERKLGLQNDNPVKVLTSGLEGRVPRFWANGKWRQEGRLPWWEGYGPGEPFCVFGHYWRTRLA